MEAPWAAVLALEPGAQGLAPCPDIEAFFAAGTLEPDAAAYLDARSSTDQRTVLR